MLLYNIKQTNEQKLKIKYLENTYVTLLEMSLLLEEMHLNLQDLK